MKIYLQYLFMLAWKKLFSVRWYLLNYEKQISRRPTIFTIILRFVTTFNWVGGITFVINKSSENNKIVTNQSLSWNECYKAKTY